MGACILFEDNICFLGKRKEHYIIFPAWQTCKRCKTSVFIFSPLKSILLTLVDLLIVNADLPTRNGDLREEVQESENMESTTKCKTAKLSDPYACRAPPRS